MNTPPVLVYDGSFEGFLTCIFEVYNKNMDPKEIRSTPVQDLFQESIIIQTNEEYCDRVWTGLLNKPGGHRQSYFLYQCFLSEIPGVELKILYLIRYILSGVPHKMNDFSDPTILELHKIKKKIRREVHRMHAFVRFQDTKDQIWSCEIAPDFNVLPLIGKHFQERYPAQNWLIFDTKRAYGIYYAINKEIETVTFSDYQKNDRLIKKDNLTVAEIAYQSLWKQYFQSVNIQERNNPKLHLQHVPKRYWKYLIEKS